MLVIVGLAAYLLYELFKPFKDFGPLTELPDDGSDKLTTDKDLLKALREKGIPNSLKKVEIYYGSQTGHAAKFSEAISHDLDVIGIENEVIDAFDYTPEMLMNEEVFGIFVMATSGDGDPTDNCAKLHQYIKESEHDGKKVFGGGYCAFGLCHSDYEHFNAMGSFFDVNIKKVGGIKVAPVGTSDFKHPGDVEDEFKLWKKKVWPKVMAYYEKTSDGVYFPKDHTVNMPKYPFRVRYVHKDEDLKPKIEDKELHILYRQWTQGQDLPVTSMRELKQSTQHGSTLEVILDVTNSDLSYKTADNISIYSTYSDEYLERLAIRFQLQLN